ncbi:hypothetical protein N9355_08770 [Crocinitomicaceae bacterium]|nr:hypothetical protein [Crocinitomicaceae bacterium]
MRITAILLGVLVLAACNKKPTQSDLEQFVAENQGRTEDFLIACAAGNMEEFMGSTERPISIFYYNVDGASTASLYVKLEEGKKDDLCYYSKVNEAPEALFNGRMGRFTVSKYYTDKWVIVTYSTGFSYNVSDPILLRADSHPTVDISNKLAVMGDSLQPEFNWFADPVKGNVIYFSLISNAANDFVSGVYTEEKEWDFYDFSNVVLNVTPTMSPTLDAQDSYVYTNMGVGENNWVRTFGTLSF